jgi:hypothetical protein
VRGATITRENVALGGRHLVTTKRVIQVRQMVFSEASAVHHKEDLRKTATEPSGRWGEVPVVCMRVPNFGPAERTYNER